MSAIRGLGYAALLSATAYLFTYDVFLICRAGWHIWGPR
jgi:hypothetical protein